MKLRTILFALTITPFLFADENQHDHKKHDHDHHHESKAPNGGRVLHDIVPHAEFFITKDRKVQITFLNDHGKAIASDQKLTAIGGKRAKPTKFTFKKTKTGFFSNEKLPEGNLVPIVLTFSHDGKTKRVRFNVNMADCPTCEFLEYACTCDHEHVGEGHDHEKKK